MYNTNYKTSTNKAMYNIIILFYNVYLILTIIKTSSMLKKHVL